MELEYAEGVNPNLICCICHCPFLSPMTAPCGHTFCRVCIEQTFIASDDAFASVITEPALPGDGESSHSEIESEHVSQVLETTVLCPVDRLPLSYNSLKKADKIVINLVNELLVYCYNKAAGCIWKGQRQNMGFHAKECLYRLNHHAACIKKPVMCPFCEKAIAKSELDEHLANICQERSVNCTLSRFGCLWVGKRGQLETHETEQCVFKPVKNYLEEQIVLQKKLIADNNSMKETIASLEEKLLQLENRVHPLTESRVADEVLFERMDKLSVEIDQIKSSFDQMSSHVTAIELKSDMAILTETSRLREEWQAFRVQYYLEHYRSNATSTSSPTSFSVTNKSQSQENSRAQSAPQPTLSKSDTSSKRSTRL